MYEIYYGTIGKKEKNWVQLEINIDKYIGELKEN